MGALPVAQVSLSVESKLATRIGPNSPLERHPSNSRHERRSWPFEYGHSQFENFPGCIRAETQIRAGVRRRCRRDRAEDDSARSPAYTTVDAQLGYRRPGQWLIAVDAFNLLDVKWNDIEY